MGKKIRTETIHYGVDPDVHYGSINDPIYKNSTLVFQNYKSFLKAKRTDLMFLITEELVHIPQEGSDSLAQNFITQKNQ